MSDSLPDADSAPVVPAPCATKPKFRIDPEYHKVLTDCEHKMIDEFDKAVMALSGGAIGVSFAFLKDIVNTATMVHTAYLLFAWGAWGLSVLTVLTSFYFSHIAMRKTQEQLETNPDTPVGELGGCWNSCTVWLNPTGGILFAVGLICMIVFVSFNTPDGQRNAAGSLGKTNANARATNTAATTGTTSSIIAAPAPTAAPRTR